jgi:hypothetical protein
VKIKKTTTRSELKKAGLELVRDLGDDHTIIRSLGRNPMQYPYLFEHISPVNHLWKLSDDALNASRTTRMRFTIKTFPHKNINQELNAHDDLRVIRATGNILILETTLESLLDHVITHDAVQYIGLESDTPIEESRVLDLNLNPNTVNRIHHDYPDLNGSGMTLSMKELHYNTDDIDLHGRHLTSSLGASEVSDHATDMATIAAGSGNSFVTGKGVASSVRITSSDYFNLFPDSDEDFAALDVWVQNHSYGTVIETFYGALAEAYDLSANRNPDLLHIFSSGNQGAAISTTGAYRDIPGFANLTGNSKMAKNILTVGAVDTTGNPIAFSSRGPAHDGRIKPELVAYSTQGTSNSTALVSGVAVLLQQAYREENGIIPPAALIKSMLINAADDVGKKGPDFVTGFGNVDAYRALSELRNEHYFAGTISDGEVKTFLPDIPSGAINLKLTLVWNDPAADVNTGKVLVNDLDLTLERSGTTWQPWILNASANATHLNEAAVRGEDHLNNIEQITLEDPEPGVYTVSVKGFDIPDGPQSFYISYQWDMAGQFEWEFPTASDNIPYNGETGTYFYWNSTLTENTGRLEYSFDGGTTWLVISDEIDLRKGYFRWGDPPDIAAMAEARMVTETGSFATGNFSISRPVDVSVGFNCADSVMIQWLPLPTVSQFKVYAYMNSVMEEIATVSDTAFIFRKNEFNAALFAVAPVLNAGPGIRSPAFDYNAIGSACFIFSFRDEVIPEEGVYLNLELGTTYGVDQLVFEHQTTGTFNPIGMVDVNKSNVIRFLHETPAQGYNRYRVRLKFQNGEEVLSDTLENFFLTERPFFVFPNPVTSAQPLRIFSRVFENLQVTFQLYRTDGTLVMNADLLSDREFISLEQFPPGLYVYRIRSEEGYYKGKLVIKD